MYSDAGAIIGEVSNKTILKTSNPELDLTVMLEGRNFVDRRSGEQFETSSPFFLAAESF